MVSKPCISAFETLAPEEANQVVSMISTYGITEFQNPDRAYSQHVAVFVILPLNLCTIN